MSWGDRFLSHYEKFLGEPADRVGVIFDERVGIVQALFYEGVVPGCVMIATLGVSKLELGERSCEICCLIDSLHREIAVGLLSCMKCIHTHKQEFGWGTAIGGLAGMQTVSGWPGNMDGFYFSRLINAPEEFAVVKGEGSNGVMYSAVPITDGEYRYYDKFGVGRFEDLLEKSKVDVAEVGRSSIC